MLVVKTESGREMTVAEQAGLRLGKDDENLDDILGPYPNRESHNEAGAHRALRVGNEKTEYRPDAEVRFAGDVLIVERETRRSRPTEEGIFQKIAQRAEYVNHILQKPDEATILFVCDTPRDIHYADRAASRLDVEVVPGTPEQIAEYLLEHARAAVEHGRTA